MTVEDDVIISQWSCNGVRPRYSFTNILFSFKTHVY